RDPRAVFANPTIPDICPMLAVGMYLLSGTNQYHRFLMSLHRTMSVPAQGEEMERLGIKADEIGTHSVRKGAATFGASGSTQCPPVVALTERAGW
ncbi:hypothetical protein GUITHDRAFT_52229, partial [Guillardia theta CCMP2712]